jgi:hypothetical protein
MITINYDLLRLVRTHWRTLPVIITFPHDGTGETPYILSPSLAGTTTRLPPLSLVVTYRRSNYEK